MTPQRIEDGYENIKRIIDFLIGLNDIKYVASLDAPSNFDAMVDHYKEHGIFHVYSGGDNDIYLGLNYNIKFRALHDFMHYTNNLTFSFKDERILSEITAKQFNVIGWRVFGMTIAECYDVSDIINAEMKGQIDYYELNKKYVADQKAFINDYLLDRDLKAC